jgi:DNA polymerase III alpha subunit (gram-positive type)
MNLKELGIILHRRIRVYSEIETLSNAGCLNELPETNQLSIFNLSAY